MAFISLSTAGEVHQDNVLVVFDVNINLISCRCINIFKLNKTLWVFIIFSFDSNSNTGGNLQQETCSSTLAGSLYSSQCRWGQMTFCGLHYAWTMKVNIACQVMPLAIDVWIGRDWGRKKKKLVKVNLCRFWIPSPSPVAVLVKAAMAAAASEQQLLLNSVHNQIAALAELAPVKKWAHTESAASNELGVSAGL